MKIITDATCTSYHTPGHPERPERILGALDKLRAQTELNIDWLEPEAVNDEAILRAHSSEYLARLRVPLDFDADTSYFPEIEMIARRAAGAGLLALEFAGRNDTAFSLMRPPGHHATRDHVMGFCYLSNMAIAILQAVATGSRRAAVFDFDVHHGNGTEDILVNNPNAAFFSVHEHPCYPGTGAANVGNNCFNYPVAPFVPRGDYRKTLSKALEDLRKYKPELIGVSAGFDAYSGDPLAQGSLELEDYHWLGSELRKLGVPMFSLLEGGYSDELPELVFAYLKGIDGK